ncbi:MAG TPA: pyridoxamine 5'-phosphate oxidase family protein [Kineosporiaceae bacterium]|nr:pyridoxamine 5'-phosphate oxidase family protein [Kineosporiaceae bacterium]
MNDLDRTGVNGDAGAPGPATAAAPRRPQRPHTTVRRLPEKQVHDRAALDALLDAALIGHVAVVESGDGTAAPRPYVVPVALARDEDEVLVHGSTASRAFRALATGMPTCLTVTVVDGVIVARSQFESSLRYHSAMVFGSFEVLHGQEKQRALAVLATRLLPGLDGGREPSARELAATAVLSLPLEDWSLKVSAGHPEDAKADLDRQVWAGTVPLRHVWGEPVAAPDLAPELTVPAAVARWPQGRF